MALELRGLASTCLREAFGCSQSGLCGGVVSPFFRKVATDGLCSGGIGGGEEGGKAEEIAKVAYFSGLLASWAEGGAASFRDPLFDALVTVQMAAFKTTCMVITAICPCFKTYCADVCFFYRLGRCSVWIRGR